MNVTPAAQIQDAISLAAEGATINLAAGVYTEQVDINKPVSLLGAEAGVDGRGRTGSETIIQPSVSSPDPNDGDFISVLYVDADNVTIDGLTLNGDNTSLTSGVNVNGADVDAEDAISMFDAHNGLHIRNNIIRNFSYTGIDIFPADIDPTLGLSSNIHNFGNTVNVAVSVNVEPGAQAYEQLRSTSVSTPRCWRLHPRLKFKTCSVPSGQLPMAGALRPIFCTPAQDTLRVAFSNNLLHASPNTSGTIANLPFTVLTADQSGFIPLNIAPVDPRGGGP